MAGIDSYTKLMLHGDATPLVDSSLSPKSITAAGSAGYSTTEKKFGSGSIYFDGTTDYLTVPDSDDWTLGTGNFTIDFWTNFSSLTTNDTWFQQSSGTSANTWFGGIGTVSGNTISPRFVVVSGGSTLISDSTVSTITVNTGTWYHFAFVRNGSSLLFFFDGVSQAMNIGTTTADLPNMTGVLNIGYNDIAAGRDLHGYIDEFRWSKGIARWTSNFTPPTEAYSADVTGGFMTTNKGFWGA